MEPKKIKALDLSEEETREIITPYAFKIDKSLLGMQLASPARRALAMLIDISFIFIAAKLSATIISVVAALAFYKGMTDKYLPDTKLWIRKLLKILAATVLFVSTVLLLAETIDYLNPTDSFIKMNNEQKFTKADQAIISKYLTKTADDSCELNCQQQAITELFAALPQISSIKDQESDNIDNPKAIRLAVLLIFEASKLKLDTLPPPKPNKTDETPKSDKVTTSIIEWTKGIISDLGLGFGWAAIYFTLFTLLWRGQTLGKKFLGIRVIALSGNYLNAWDSFGRYGGYGAGFATGLLGFLQIYWDPNRQAIQDKISGTVVIKGDLKQHAPD